MTNTKTERGRDLSKLTLQASGKAGIQTHSRLQNLGSLHRSFCGLFPLNEYTDQNLMNSSLAFCLWKKCGERSHALGYLSKALLCTLGNSRDYAHLGKSSPCTLDLYLDCSQATYWAS